MFKLHIYWHSLNREDGRENYGDALAPFICSKLAKKKIVRVQFLKSKKYRLFVKHYFTLGSIIKRINSNSIVWGSGIIKKDELITNATFLAVRGPRTRARLLELGYDAIPEKYGDPALLLPQFISNNEKKTYALGIIPHFVDYEDVKKIFSDKKDIKVIDLVTDDVVKTTQEILECEAIISSSLHGLIIPHTYKIPALWMKFSDNLSGDNIKFYDYFESVGITYNEEFKFSAEQKSKNILLELLKSNSTITQPDTNLLNLRKKQLLETCPFIKKD
nr:polysaccharide pyruvyl transferase family protein [uncultured Psychroserpens sp.]